MLNPHEDRPPRDHAGTLKLLEETTGMDGVQEAKKHVEHLSSTYFPCRRYLLPEWTEITHVFLAYANLYVSLRSTVTCLSLEDISQTYLE